MDWETEPTSDRDRVIWLEHVRSEQAKRIAELEGYLNAILGPDRAKIDYGERAIEQLAGRVFDRDKRIAELEAEVELHLNGSARIASRAQKAESQRDRLAQALRLIAEFERRERLLRADINGKPAGMSVAESIARSALSEMEEKP